MVRRILASDLPETIPVFPLPGAIVLPRARLPLNIFEPRYLAMLDDTMKSDHRLIGMIQPKEDGDRWHNIGCAGRLIQFSETEDGRYAISLGGVSRFRMVSKVDGFTPYVRAAVDWSDYTGDLGGAQTDPEFDRDRFLQLLGRYFNAANLSTDWESLAKADEELLVNSLAMMCPFEPEEKQVLLESDGLPARRQTLVTLMEFSLAASGPEEGSLQ